MAENDGTLPVFLTKKKKKTGLEKSYSRGSRHPRDAIIWVRGPHMAEIFETRRKCRKDAGSRQETARGREQTRDENLSFFFLLFASDKRR